MARTTSRTTSAIPPQLWSHLPEQVRRQLAAQIARALRQTLHDDPRVGNGDAENPSRG